ncbi:hypothetical protein [Terracidiphilus sp.]|uniref:hypothetical protein n=1 Tax=Terracidiphilus sp. TaxID=1964191 RepID=UPI003C1BE0C0
MTEQHPSRVEYLAAIASCVAVSLIAIAWSWRHGAMLNYGDAVAHLHIARRVFDSHRPGLTQLGSVWLPLPHLLLIPFVAVHAWWANGAAALIPSALAWLASCAGLYRLARRWLAPTPAVIALAFFALNPNLLYLQTTAMTEPLFVCEMVWTAVWLVEWRAALDSDSEYAGKGLLWRIALVLVAAVYTRYDGWIMALLAWCAIGVALLRRGRLRSRTFWLASAVVVAAPVVWLVYNATVFGDWLDFVRGPYSASAIEMRTATPGTGPPHPGWHNLWVSLIFYVKCAEMDAAALPWGNILLVVSVLGSIYAWFLARKRTFAWALLLWLPVPFYAYSVAYGSVPIFLPVWWPHSWYNTRYGLEMLPAFALSLGFAASLIIAAAREFKPRLASAVAALLLLLVVINCLVMLREGPPVYIEGTKNIESRRSYEVEIPTALRAYLQKSPGGVILMDTSVYPQIVAFTGIPLKQTINESDKEFYSAALSAPAQHAAVVLAFDGDEVDRAVHAHPQGLKEVQRFTAPWQPPGTLYVSVTPGVATSTGVLVQ